MSLLNSSSEVPGEKALLIDSPGKRDKVSSTPSNVYLLNVAFYSFALFALGQMFVAVLIAKSQAMVGDSSAMVIDSLTYLFNSYAEKIKNKSLKESVDDTLSAAEKELRRLERTRQRLWLEILPPLCSVMTLIVLTIYIIIDALNTLAEPDYVVGEDGSPDSNDEPNIGVMFFFSALNLGLDILNVTCFARAKHAFGFAVIDKDRHRYVLAYDGSLHNEMADSMKRERSEVDFSDLHTDHEDDSTENYSSISEAKKPDAVHILPSVEEEANSDDINLNMCSAYTHVFADTLRSTAVLIAAGLSYCLKIGEPQFVDAVAALAVSIIILLSLGPLLNGIIHAAEQLKQLSKLKTRFSPVPV
mmetsp:Transcript_1146/g.1921  ORF Transcript_1146/g.1921 Transcript_1146/m.1921 type:complete len:359 (+) Transcript_1146:82-1158(+)|eukprot:scaffold20274_cov114-Skeletonema_dohrnii-CCMP3373.AAC.1